MRCPRSRLSCVVTLVQLRAPTRCHSGFVGLLPRRSPGSLALCVGKCPRCPIALRTPVFYWPWHRRRSAAPSSLTTERFEQESPSPRRKKAHMRRPPRTSKNEPTGERVAVKGPKSPKGREGGRFPEARMQGRGGMFVEEIWGAQFWGCHPLWNQGGQRSSGWSGSWKLVVALATRRRRRNGTTGPRATPTEGLGKRSARIVGRSDAEANESVAHEASHPKRSLRTLSNRPAGAHTQKHVRSHVRSAEGCDLHLCRYSKPGLGCAHVCALWL